MCTHMWYHSNGGKFLDYTPPLTFLVEPSHRIKVMDLSTFKLVQGKSEDPKRRKKINEMRINT